MPAAKTDDALAHLLKAIFAKWAATSALTSAMKGPWLHEKPARYQSYPNYAIVMPGTSIDDGWSCKRRYWLHEPEFRFYAKTPELSNTNLTVFLSIFSVEGLALPFDIGGMTQHRSRRITYIQDDRKVHYSSATFRFRTWMDRS